MKKFDNRQSAGLALAKMLTEYANEANVIVLALPRGGVPVAYEIAKVLHLPLDVFIVRKLGVPGQEELAMGAIASGGTVVFNEPLLQSLNLEQSTLDDIVKSEQREVARREYVYRGQRSFPVVEGKTILLVDDGIATGSTMRAAIKALQLSKPARIIMVVPVAAISTCKEMAALGEIICPLQLRDFQAVGLCYEQFPQTTDKEVLELLEKS